MAVNGTSPGVQKKVGSIKKKRKTRPTGQLTVPGCAAIDLPSRDCLEALDAESQDRVVDMLGRSNGRLVALISDCLEAHRKDSEKGDVPRHVASVEDTVLGDMARLRDQSGAREFVECTLWRRIRALNSKVFSSSGGDTEDPGVSSSEKLTFETLSHAHLTTLTERFAKDLETLHEKESMDTDKVARLLKCLAEGADLFAAYRT